MGFTSRYQPHALIRQPEKGNHIDHGEAPMKDIGYFTYKATVQAYRQFLGNDQKMRKDLIQAAKNGSYAAKAALWDLYKLKVTLTRRKTK